VDATFFRGLYVFWFAFSTMIRYLGLRMRRPFVRRAKYRAMELAFLVSLGRRFTRAALRYGGLVIKIGQFLSARVDILPKVFIDELAGLQDQVPGAPFPAIQRQVEAELGVPLHELFASFEEEAVASASLGQVHRATLRNGHVVAVKVLRPGIERIVEADLGVVRWFLTWMNRLTSWGNRFDLHAIYEEFRTVVDQEMDYLQEAENLRMFQQNMAGKNHVRVPRLYDTLTRRRVMVMEFIEGIKISDTDALMAAGIDPRTISRHLFDAYLEQVLVTGFVHVDPHPGNLLVERDGCLVFIDFGMMVQLRDEDRNDFTDLVLSLLKKDFHAAVRAIDRLGFLRPHANREMLRRALELIFDRLSGLRLERGPEMERFVQEMQDFFYEEPLQFPAKYMFLGRALGLVSGVITTLDPEIQWWPLLEKRAFPLLSDRRRREKHPGTGEGKDKGWTRWLDWVENVFGEGAAARLELAERQAAAWGQLLLRLPGQTERVLTLLESGELRVQMKEGAVREYRQRTLLVNRLVWAILSAAGVFASVTLATHGWTREARYAWWGTGVAGVLLLGNLVGGRRRNKRQP
jgi:predicted unusual protein kinase regulating ubiquinone biosynthesis (AarF/ABC1/UbiB family)